MAPAAFSLRGAVCRTASHRMAHPLQLMMLAVYFGAILALVVLMIVLSAVLGERHETQATIQPFESGMLPVGQARLRFPQQFYLIAVFFVVFDLESAFIYAWAVAARQVGWAGYIEVVVFIVILAAALAYLWRVGALDWTPLRSRRSRPSRHLRHSSGSRDNHDSGESRRAPRSDQGEP